MNEQEKRDAGRAFGDHLRKKLAANRQDLTERLFGRPSTEESGSPKETPDEPPRDQGPASEGS